MNFRVGQKVVCVLEPTINPLSLIKGEVYTISEAGLISPSTGEPLVVLKEHGSQGYWARRFRPLVERKTDTGIAILKSILEDAENYKVIETV